MWSAPFRSAGAASFRSFVARVWRNRSVLFIGTSAQQADLSGAKKLIPNVDISIYGRKSHSLA
jgi:hypothetical protein